MEALNRRACEHWVGEVSTALLGRLRDTASQCSLRPELNTRGLRRRLIRIESLTDNTVLHEAAGAHGWSLIAADGAPEPEMRNQAFDNLQLWLCQWIAGTGYSPPGDCFVVDSRGGKEIATTLAELIETGLRRGIRNLWFAGRRIELNTGEWDLLRDHLEVRIGPGIDFVGREAARRTAHFKRYRPPYVLSPEEAGFLGELEAGTASIRSAPVHTLWEAGVVECILEEEV